MAADVQVVEWGEVVIGKYTERIRGMSWIERESQEKTIRKTGYRLLEQGLLAMDGFLRGGKAAGI